MRITIPSSIEAASSGNTKPLAPYRYSPAGEEGWALLGIILALSVMGIMLAALAPNVAFQVRRDKEAEMLYRGEQMAKAIARYYNNGREGNINPFNCPQPRGCLVEIEKIKEPYLIGVNEIKLVRLSATIDPMTNTDWEPVRICDSRLMTVLQAYASATGLMIPDIYERMAGPPPPIITDPDNPDTQPGQPPGQQPGQGNPQVINPGVITPGGNTPSPCERLSGSGSSDLGNIPIVGVAPKIKGESVRTLYGLGRYEEWVFIYIHPQAIRIGQPPATPPGSPPGAPPVTPPGTPPGKVSP